jgi:hypothetical protein
MHAIIATRLVVWLAAGGVPADRIAQAVGLRIPGRDGVGGRIPDLVVWSKAQPVTMYRLTGDHYTVQATMPLAWLLNATPAGHDLR